MVIREADVDSIRYWVGRGRVDDVARLTFDGVTLGAVLELACAWVQWQAEHRVEAESIAEAWALRIPAIREAYDALGAQKPLPSGVSEFGAPSSEFLAIRSRGDWMEQGGLLFQTRFARTLQDNGFPRATALGLVAAFAEMADNIVQHSGNTSQSPVQPRASSHSRPQGQNPPFAI